MAVDGRVYLAQKELLSWQVAEPLPRCVGTAVALHEAEAVQDVSGGGDGADGRVAARAIEKLGANDLHRFNSRAGSGFGKRVANWIGREYAYPTNVLHMATECYNRYHAATFPVELPAWFIKLFTEPGDIVLDPFMGSGTTAIACIRNDRRYIGIEIVEEYVRLAEERIAREQASPNLCTFAENAVSYES
jgi:hypothetical protein